jgi:hypothetical protein
VLEAALAGNAQKINEFPCKAPVFKAFGIWMSFASFRYFLGTVMGTPLIRKAEKSTEVIKKDMVGDTGFEPVTPTV